MDPVNTHIVWAASLAAGALAVFTVAALLRSDRAVPPPGQHLHRLGTAVTLLGVVLCIGGASGIALLVADPTASLFLYVRRPVVVLLGVLLLLPAALLIVLGRGASMLAEFRAAEGRDEPP